jgi:dTDP-4-amino-4,6-dideoxygalactose transaminase
MPYRIYLSPPAQNGQEQLAVDDCLRSNWLAPVGPHLEQFEKSLSDLHNHKPIVALNSGTAAIHLALILCGVTSGDTVLVASHTHNATVNPVIYQGATPVFIDSEEDTWNMSPKYLHAAILDSIKNGIKPKAIIVVHLYGMPAKMKEILEIANGFDIPIIEDAAESLGSKLQSKPLGTFGRFGILSFNGNKIITTSGGGALICPDDEMREKALFYATQARDQAPHFEHSEIGYNYRLSNLLAALGNAQLKDLSARIAMRRAIFNRYMDAFMALNDKLGKTVVISTYEYAEAFSNRWLSSFLITPLNNITASSWREALEKAGIESRPLWKPMHLQPVFKNSSFFGDHTSDRIFEQGICLPSGTDLSAENQQEIIAILSDLYQ